MKILSFTVENFKSFRREATLSFIASAQRDAPDFRIPSRHAPHGVLPVLGLYGANASGKSNLVLALLRMRDHVVHSFALAPDGDIPWSPWRMDRSDTAPPTRFALDFEWKEVRYHYAFTHHRRVFMSETLWRWQTHRPEVLFLRDGKTWKFSRNLGGAKSRIAEQTRDNALFLSTAAQLNHPMLRDIFEAFSAGIRRESHIELHGHPAFAPGAPIVAERNRPLVNALVRALDLGCHGIELTELKPSFDELESVMTPEALQSIKTSTPPALLAVGLMRRDDSDGTSWTLPPSQESRGTQVILQRVNDLLAQRETPGILVIDELETSLHPDICRVLLAFHTDPAVNDGGRQLLFTTHERTLLEALRRDEIHLVDKDQTGESTLAAASDYKFLRKENNLSALHAQGRLGGVPVIGDIASAWGAR